MPYLLKSEPDKYSFDDLLRDGETTWDGISNNQALITLRNMKKGEKLVIYHSNVGKAAVGTAKVVSVDAIRPRKIPRSASKPASASSAKSPSPKSATPPSSKTPSSSASSASPSSPSPTSSTTGSPSPKPSESPCPQSKKHSPCGKPPQRDAQTQHPPPPASVIAPHQKT